MPGNDQAPVPLITPDFHPEEITMRQTESYQDLVLGSGAGGKLLAWHFGGLRAAHAPSRANAGTPQAPYLAGR
jgi:hypothetical protein